MSNICENCNEKDTIISDEESGKIYCQNCGLVCKGKILSDDNDKRTFEGNDGEKKSREWILFLILIKLEPFL